MITSFSAEEAKDFRVGIKEFKENVSCMRKTKPFVKNKILQAVGV